MVAKLGTTSHNTTQHTTTNMSRCHPTLQQICLLSSWIGQRRPQIIVLSLPMGPLQAPSAGFAHAMASSLVWGNKIRHIKNREIGGALILDGRRLVKKAANNKQLAEAMGGMMKRDCGWGGVYGRCCLFVWGSKLSNAKNT
jgi:hypothetical protein